jgi:hypothetical protein
MDERMKSVKMMARMKASMQRAVASWWEIRVEIF